MNDFRSVSLKLAVKVASSPRPVNCIMPLPAPAAVNAFCFEASCLLTPDRQRNITPKQMNDSPGLNAVSAARWKCRGGTLA